MSVTLMCIRILKSVEVCIIRNVASSRGVVLINLIWKM